MSAVFFIIWGTTGTFAVQIDTVIFNSAFIIINIVQSIPLIKQIMPVKLTELEEEIFQRDFHNHMTKRQFKHFISKFKTDWYKGDGSQICVHDSNFRYLIYIAKIFPGWRVVLTSSTRHLQVKEIKEGSWIGTIEYVLYEQANQGLKKPSEAQQDVSWGISAYLESIKEHEIIDMNAQSITEAKLVPKGINGAVVYIIDLDVY
jgi:hypothetical protein